MSFLWLALSKLAMRDSSFDKDFVTDVVSLSMRPSKYVFCSWRVATWRPRNTYQSSNQGKLRPKYTCPASCTFSDRSNGVSNCMPFCRSSSTSCNCHVRLGVWPTRPGGAQQLVIPAICPTSLHHGLSKQDGLVLKVRTLMVLSLV